MHRERNRPEPGAHEPQTDFAEGEPHGAAAGDEKNGDGSDDDPEKQAAVNGDPHVVGGAEQLPQPGGERNACDDGETGTGEFAAEKSVIFVGK